MKLLDKVRGHDELEILINKTGRDSDVETYERLARFKLALQYNEKKVCYLRYNIYNASNTRTYDLTYMK